MRKISIIYLITGIFFFSCTTQESEPVPETETKKVKKCSNCTTEQRVLKTYTSGEIELAHIYENCCGEKYLIKKIEYYEGPGNKKLVEKNYKNELEHGDWIEYYENGQKKAISRYKNGLQHGKWEQYYENGRRRSVKEWKNGQKHGTWFWYKSNGSEEKRKSY